MAFVLTAGVRADIEKCWKFGEGSNITVLDSSGCGRNGLIYGSAWHAVGQDLAGKAGNVQKVGPELDDTLVINSH